MARRARRPRVLTKVLHGEEGRKRVLTLIMQGGGKCRLEGEGVTLLDFDAVVRRGLQNFSDFG